MYVYKSTHIYIELQRHRDVLEQNPETGKPNSYGAKRSKT